MGRGALTLSLAILLAALSGISVGATAEMAQLLVNEKTLYQGQPNVIHVSADPPGGKAAVDVHLTIEGIDGTQPVEVRETVEGGDQLVTTVWTPARTGSYTLEVKMTAGEDLLDVDRRSVEVQTAPRPADEEAGFLPETAPGTVQWAIAFGVLFFVARLGLERRPGS